MPSSPNIKRQSIVTTSRLFEILEKYDGPDLETDATISDLIKSYPFFNEFPLESAVQLARLCRCIRLTRGEVMCKQEDELDDSIYLLLQGTISLRTSGVTKEESTWRRTLDMEKEAPVLPPPLPRQLSKEFVHSRGSLHHAGSGIASLAREKSFNSAGFEAQYGPEVGVLSQGDLYGERVFQDNAVQNTLHASTGIVSSHHACVLRLSRADIEEAGMMPDVHSRVTHVTRTPNFDGLRKRLSVAPEKRDEDAVNFILSTLEFMPFFMHLRDSGALPELARHLTLVEIGPETKILWHEGSTTTDERYTMHVILDGEVDHYAKGSSVNPLDIRSLDWTDGESIAGILGQKRFVSKVGNVVGGPSQFGIATGDTVVALPNTVFGCIERAAWKPALSSLNRSFSCRPQHVRRLLASVMSETESQTHGLKRESSLDDVHDAKSVANELATNLRDGIQFFEQVPFGKLVELCVNFKLLSVYRNEALCIAGQPSSGVFVIFTGNADVRSHPRGLDIKPPTELEWARTLAANGDASPSRKLFYSSFIDLDPTPFFGPKVREVATGSLVFSGNTDHTWTESLLAGETSLEAIFIDTATYTQLIMPSQTPSPAVSLPNAMKTLSIDRSHRSFADREDIADFLGTLPELRRMSPKMLQHLSAAVSLRTYSEREVICEQGQPANVWFGLLQGSISFHFKNSKSPEVPQTPGSNVVFKYGSCFRVVFPGETFGQSSMLLKSDYLVTALCRETCQLFVIHRDEMDQELIEHVTASSRLLLGNSESVRKPARTRTETEILSNVNYLRDNPFFSHLSDVTLQKLAIDVQSLEFCQEESVCNPHRDRHGPADSSSTRLMVVNRGTVYCFGPPKILQTIRLQPLNVHTFKPAETRRKSTEEVEDLPEHDTSVLEASPDSLSTGFGLARLESCDPSWNEDIMKALQSLAVDSTFQDDMAKQFLSSDLNSSLREDPSSSLSSAWNYQPSPVTGSLLGTNGKHGAPDLASKQTPALASPVVKPATGNPMKPSLGGRSGVGDLASNRTPSLVSPLVKPYSERPTMPLMSGFLGMGAKLHFANMASRKNVKKQIVAAYGQAFWSTFPCFAEDDVQVLAFSRRKWKSLVAGASSGENQDVVSFLQTHPCFARSKNAEISTLLSQGRSINLEPNSVLFRAGDVLSDVYFLKKGSIEIRTGIELGRGELSAGDTHVIPSVVVALLSKNAVVSQVIAGLSSMLPGEGALQWSAHAEAFTAVATSRTTVIALSKSQLLQGAAEDRLQRIQVLERLTESFHPQRIEEIEKARHGMIHGERVMPWHASVLRERRDLRHVITNLQHKQFATQQPRVFSHVKSQQVLPEAESTNLLNAVLSPRVDCLKLPRVVNRRTFVPKYSAEAPATTRPTASRSLDGTSPFDAGRSHGALPPGGLRLLQNQVESVHERSGHTPRDLVLRHGRPPRIASIHRPQPARHPALARPAAVKLTGQAIPQNSVPLTIQDLLRESKAESKQHPLKPYMRAQ